MKASVSGADLRRMLVVIDSHDDNSSGADQTRQTVEECLRRVQLTEQIGRQHAVELTDI